MNMRAQGYVLCGVLLVAGMSTAANAQTWNEDFSGSSVNTGDWNFETGTAPNNELEWYQTNNATVAGGVLTIQARRQAVGGMQYTSPRINTSLSSVTAASASTCPPPRRPTGCNSNSSPATAPRPSLSN
jgi:beta-glucanase (GH16 family)